MTSKCRSAVLFVIFLFFCAFPALEAEVTHTVRKGQTIYSIARAYNVPVDLLQEYNGIADPSTLSVGTELVVPDTYEVRRGDTFYSIAHEHGMSVDELLEVNNRSRASVLKAGEVLYVPREGSSRTANSGDENRSGTSRSSEQGANEASGERGDAEGDSPGGNAEQEEARGFPAVARTIPPSEDTASLDWPLSGSRERMSGKFPGVMISGESGEPVKAVSSGRVVYAGPHTAFGKVVFIQSEMGYIYVYAGQGELRVTVGDVVTAGMEIGRLGSAPASDSPRLYFSVWRNNRFVDPRSAPRG